ncbi:SBBP repeat-containing protein [Nannocystis pusilla]|uniref:SBBP repeat-containing protein n=1 Tax=Nannocystis pusilla TaxID=889268 RepID=UPI003B7F7488
MPAPESCDLAGDEDCDGADPCMGEGTVGWSRIFGGPTEDYGKGVAFDSAGNVVVAATSTQSIDFGGGPLIGAGVYPDYDVYVAKFSPTGAHLWSKRFGDADGQGFRLAITTTAAGEIVMAGDARGTIDFGGGPLVNGPNPGGFLVKFTGDGEHVWSKVIKGGKEFEPHLAVDEGGNIVLAGSCRSDIDLGGGVMVAGGETDVFSPISSAGAHQWSRRFGDLQSQSAHSVGVDGAANIYMTGGFRGAIDPGSGPLISAGELDMFVAKFDPAGQAVWGVRFGGAGDEYGDGLVVDSKDRITITGFTNQSIDFGGGPLVPPDAASVLAQFDTSGAHQWSRLLCTTGLGRAHIATDGFDSVLLAGLVQGQCDVGGGLLTAADELAILVAKLTPPAITCGASASGKSVSRARLPSPAPPPASSPQPAASTARSISATARRPTLWLRRRLHRHLQPVMSMALTLALEQVKPFTARRARGFGVRRKGIAARPRGQRAFIARAPPKRSRAPIKRQEVDTRRLAPAAPTERLTARPPRPDLGTDHVRNCLLLEPLVHNVHRRRARRAAVPHRLRIEGRRDRRRRVSVRRTARGVSRPFPLERSLCGRMPCQNLRRKDTLGRSLQP